MNPLVQLSKQVQHLFFALLFASFAVAQSVQAEPNEADLIGNVTEEDNAVPGIGSDTVEAVMGQTANTPNQRVLQVKDFEKSLQCAGGKVKLSFKVAVTFSHAKNGIVGRHSIKFLGFKGTAVGGRELKATEKGLKFERCYNCINEANKEGFFSFQFLVTGPGLPASSPFQFLVKYRMNFYKWSEGKVTGEVIWDKTPEVRCADFEFVP